MTASRILGRMIGLSAVSAAGVVASFLVVMVTVFFFPVMTDGPAPRTEPGRAYSWEDLERAERESNARLEKAYEELKQKTFLEVLTEIKRYWVTVSWLPWLVVGFLCVPKAVGDVVMLLSVPVALSIVGGVWVGELPAYAGALGVGALLRRFLDKRSLQGRASDSG